MANPNGPQPTPLSSQSYASPLLAAMAALSSAQQQKQNSEWAGGVFQNGQGQYQYTVPQAGSESHFDLKLSVPKEDKLSALYHTHPKYDANGQDVGQKSDEMFSPNDVQVADQLKVPSFIWTGYDGKNREYVPGQTPTKDVYVPGNDDYETGSQGVVVSPPQQNAVAQALMQQAQTPKPVQSASPLVTALATAAANANAQK